MAASYGAEDPPPASAARQICSVSAPGGEREGRAADSCDRAPFVDHRPSQMPKAQRTHPRQVARWSGPLAVRPPNVQKSDARTEWVETFKAWEPPWWRWRQHYARGAASSRAPTIARVPASPAASIETVRGALHAVSPREGLSGISGGSARGPSLAVGIACWKAATPNGMLAYT